MEVPTLAVDSNLSFWTLTSVLQNTIYTCSIHCTWIRCTTITIYVCKIKY